MSTPGALTVELSARDSYVMDGPVELVAVVRNTSDERQKFCTYHTPFEGIRNDIFVVQRGPSPLDYRGMMAKRAPPGPSDHVTLAPRASSDRATVDLRSGYELVPGAYRVRFAGGGISGLPDSEWVEFTIKR